MRVTTVKVKNFRLLLDTDLVLCDSATLLVGRNNTGKTSLAELIERFLNPSESRFRIADFSEDSYSKFLDAYQHFQAGDIDLAYAALPSISMEMTIKYDPELYEYGPLAPLILNFESDSDEALVKFEYAILNGKLGDLFASVPASSDQESITDIAGLLKHVMDRIKVAYRRKITAVDPLDEANTRKLTIEQVRELITFDFLKAQRGLDDDKEKPKDLIARIFESLFAAAAKSDDESAHRQVMEGLTTSVKRIEAELEVHVKKMVDSLVPTLKKLGYPGLGNQELSTQTRLNVERILTNYTSVHYKGSTGVSLPESYSGLGSRSLVYILLALLGFYREFTCRGNLPGIHLVFIEEPEVHLHPQMQEVFIDQITNLKALFAELDKESIPWAVQFLVSTHSSHIANKSSFENVRYFRVRMDEKVNIRSHAEILDVSKAPNLDEEFLHQYLTLTRADLFFADKAILVEGTSERLLIPKMIAALDEEEGTDLSSQYITLMEVGGAYANLFFPLLDFIGLPSLVITDIDAVRKSEGDTKFRKCRVHQGEKTSNTTIKTWFGKKDASISSIQALAETGEIVQGIRYLAYQTPELDRSECGRTFEDAFILANRARFELDAEATREELEERAFELASGRSKSEFALYYAIHDQDWNIPRYIHRGLVWLSSISVNRDSKSGSEIMEAGKLWTGTPLT
ncbi:ATP-dependent nuclease [Glycomyces albidus]|uniref:ATP-dependent nuclease n=1 Tax=Glycomyces albidus TaxID=2656774 RepID=UPI0018837278|nr:ATP-dependent endonuclease [Glycomyces albidus]